MLNQPLTLFNMQIPTNYASYLAPTLAKSLLFILFSGSMPIAHAAEENQKEGQTKQINLTQALKALNRVNQEKKDEDATKKASKNPKEQNKLPVRKPSKPRRVCTIADLQNGNTTTSQNERRFRNPISKRSGIHGLEDLPPNKADLLPQIQKMLCKANEKTQKEIKECRSELKEMIKERKEGDEKQKDLNRQHKEIYDSIMLEVEKNNTSLKDVREDQEKIRQRVVHLTEDTHEMRQSTEEMIQRTDENLKRTKENRKLTKENLERTEKNLRNLRQNNNMLQDMIDRMKKNARPTSAQVQEEEKSQEVSLITSESMLKEPEVQLQVNTQVQEKNNASILFNTTSETGIDPAIDSNPGISLPVQQDSQPQNEAATWAGWAKNRFLTISAGATTLVATFSLFTSSFTKKGKKGRK